MKDIVNVSIAGIAFRLDADAYARLSDYLDRIRAGYGDSADGREIQSDLEARIAELILTAQDASTVVPLPLIDSALAQLGAPEGVIDPAMADSPVSSASSSSASGASIPHRLYRNPEGAKLGGVCSGLATYFNVDPSLVRLIFAAPLVLMVAFYIFGWRHGGNTMVGFMTTAFILYPLLWIVIPKARTPLQKLEMQGEKITRETIEQTYRAEFDRPGNAPYNIEQRARNARNASVFSEIVSIFGRIVLFFIKAIVAIVGFTFIMVVLGLLIALFAALFVPGSMHIDGLDVSPGWRMVVACIVLLIPFLLAVYGILKFLFGFKHNKPLLTTLSVVWLLAFVFGTVIFIKNLNNFHFDDDFIHWHSLDDSHRERDGRWEEIDATRRGMILSSTPLVVSADTLRVVPAEMLPADFVLRLHHRGDTTHLEISDYTLRGDTLLLHSPAAEAAASSVSTTVPVVIAPGISVNEYYESTPKTRN